MTMTDGCDLAVALRARGNIALPNSSTELKVINDAAVPLSSGPAAAGCVEVSMSPDKRIAKGLGGCVLAQGSTPYRLKDGVQTYAVVVPVTLVYAEPCLRRLSEAAPISCAEAIARGYAIVRSYDEAVAFGLA